MNPNMSKRRQGIPTLILTISILTIFLGVFGKSLLKERLHDMENLLEYSSKQPLNDRTFLITAKIKLLKQRMDNQKETATDFLNEFKVNRILAIENTKEQLPESSSLFSHLTALIRKLMGKADILPKQGSKEDITLEKAYQLELNRLYLKATELFKQVLKLGSYHGTLKEDYIHLHIGFCMTMAGYFEESRKQYTKLLEKGKEAGLKTLALELIDFSLLSEKRIAILKNKKISELDTIEEHLRIHNIPTAHTLIQIYLKKPFPASRPRATYLLGRILEEKGIIKKAIAAYTDVLLMGMNNYWAKMANRRLFIIGQIYHKNRQLRDLARKNSREKFKEENLFQKVSSILKENKTAKEKQASLNSKITSNLKKLSRKQKAIPKKIPEVFKTQVKILAKRYTIIRMISMKNGMRIVGSILQHNKTSIKLATVNGIASLPKSEIVRSVILYKK